MVIEPQYEGDIFEALTLLKDGDSASIVIPAEGFFTKTVGQGSLPPFLNEDDDLIFTIKVLSVMTEEEAKAADQARMLEMEEAENDIIAEYVTANDIQAEPNDNGIYYIETKKGSG